MRSQSPLSTLAAHPPQRKQSPQLDSHSRWPLGHQQVDNVQRREDVEYGDEDHDRRTPALEPGPLRQVPAVGEVEQRRVGGHHEKASRCGQYQEYDRLDARPYECRATDGHDPHDCGVDLALAPELAVSKDGHLERVASDAAYVIHDAYVGRQEHHEAGDEEELLEPGRYLVAHGHAPVLDERQIRPDILLDAYAREDQHTEGDEQQCAEKPEG